MKLVAGANIKLNPGTYYLQGDLDVAGGATPTGDGVALVFASSNGTNDATATINGYANINLTASTSGPTAGIVMFGGRNIIIRPDASARCKLTRLSQPPGSKWTRYLTYHGIPGSHQTTGRRLPAPWREERSPGAMSSATQTGRPECPSTRAPPLHKERGETGQSTYHGWGTDHGPGAADRSEYCEATGIVEAG
jgi:hypothetical protein